MEHEWINRWGVTQAAKDQWDTYWSWTWGVQSHVLLEDTHEGMCSTFQLFLGRNCLWGIFIENESYQEGINEISKDCQSKFGWETPGLELKMSMDSFECIPLK